MEVSALFFDWSPVLHILKKNFKVYLDFNDGTGTWRTPVTSEISFSRVLQEVAYSRKTLHEPNNYIEGSKVPKALPANLSFSMEMTRSLITSKVISALLEPKLVTAYIKNNSTIFIVHNIVLSASFRIEKNNSITFDLSGSGSQLVITNDSQLILNDQEDFYENKATRVASIDAYLDGAAIGSLNKLFIEVANDTTWLENKTVHSSLESDVASVSPSDFILKSRKITGNFYTYHLGDPSNSLNYRDSAYVSTPISITVLCGDNTSITFSLLECSCTTRAALEGEILSRAYDFRLSLNTSSLLSTITVTY